MNFQNAILTNVGRNLLATVHAGNKLIWTKAIISTSPVTAGAIPGMTTQAGDHWITENINIMTQGSTCHISVVFTNQGLETSLSARLCGIYAKTQVSGDDVLIAVARPNITSFAVPMESYGVMQYVIDFSMTIDNSENIELQLLTSGYASSTALQTTNQAVWQNRQDIDAIRNWKLFRTYPSVLHALAYAEEGETCSISTQTIQRFNIPQLGHPDLEGVDWVGFMVHEIVDGLVLAYLFENFGEDEHNGRVLVFRIKDMLEGDNTLLFLSPQTDFEAFPHGMCKLDDLYFLWHKTDESCAFFPIGGASLRYPLKFEQDPATFRLYSHNGKLFKKDTFILGTQPVLDHVAEVVGFRQSNLKRLTLPVYGLQGQTNSGISEQMMHCRLLTGEEAYVVYNNQNTSQSIWVYSAINDGSDMMLQEYELAPNYDQVQLIPHADGTLLLLRSEEERILKVFELSTNLNDIGNPILERERNTYDDRVASFNGYSLHMFGGVLQGSVAKAIRGGSEALTLQTNDFEGIGEMQKFINILIYVKNIFPSGCSYLPMGKDDMLCDRAFNMPFRQLLKRDGKLLPVLS